MRAFQVLHRLRLHVAAAALILSVAVIKTTAASGNDQRNSNLPRGRRQFAYQQDATPTNTLEQQNNSALASKIFFFGGQPAIAFLLASTDQHARCRLRRRLNSDVLIASTSQTENGALQLRGGVASGGGGIVPLFALARNMASVGAAMFLGITIALSERFFGILGLEVPAIFSRRRESSSTNNFFGTNLGGNAIATGYPPLSRTAVAFAAFSTLIGACLIAAATAMLAIKPEDFMTFITLDSVGVLVTLLGVLVCRGQLEWIEITAARGIVPMGILLGLLGFLTSF